MGMGGINIGGDPFEKFLPEIYKDISPAIVPLIQLVKTLGDLVNTGLIPVKILNAWAKTNEERRISIIANGIKKAQKRYPDFFAENIGNTMQAIADMPINIDEELVSRWEELISESGSPNYHPNYSKILSAMSPNDVKMLDICVRVTDKEGKITHEALKAELEPPFIDDNKNLNTELLAITFASLELQSLIATKNNLNILYWNYHIQGVAEGIQVKPQEHQVTAIGYKLHIACRRKDDAKD